MPGFTHLQHAQPTTLAHHLMAHVSALDRDFERLLDAYKYVNINPLGSAAFASTGFPLDREYTTKLLGFDRPMDNSMDGVSARDFILTTVSAVAILETSLARLADELVLWSTSEFGFVELRRFIRLHQLYHAPEEEPRYFRVDQGPERDGHRPHGSGVHHRQGAALQL